MINFDATPEDHKLILKIVGRFLTVSGIDREYALDLRMDLTACHLNGTPLRLKDLLEADDFNLTHDILGINKHLNRTTGRLDGLFVPRFALRDS